MKALLGKRYLNSFNMKRCTDAVYELFDDYNYLKTLIDNDISIPISKELLAPISNKIISNNYGLLSDLERKEKVIKELKSFDIKLNHLKQNFTEDELIIFKYSIELRETDKFVIDRICKSRQTYYEIKKSCYIKLALKFHLITDNNFLIDKNKSYLSANRNVA